MFMIQALYLQAKNEKAESHYLLPFQAVFTANSVEFART